MVPSVFIEGHCETIEIESQILFDLVDQTRAQLLAATMHRQLGAALAADNGEMATPALVTFERTALPSEPPAKLSRRDDATRMLCPGAPLPTGLMFTSLRTSLLYVADAGLEQRQTEGHGASLLGAGLVCTTRPKIKPATTLDLVILAAQWGHGRRTGRLRSYDCRRRVLMIRISPDPL